MSQDSSSPQMETMPSIPMAPPLSPNTNMEQTDSYPAAQTMPSNPQPLEPAGSLLAKTNNSPITPNPLPSSSTFPQPTLSSPPTLSTPPVAPSTATPKSFTVSKPVIVLSFTIVLLLLVSILATGPLQSLLQKAGSRTAPAGSIELAPNPTCDNACQTNLDCEGRAGGKSVRLECVKESGSSVGKCRNPLCASAVSCTCPASAAPLSQ